MADPSPFDPDRRHTLSPTTAQALQRARRATGTGRGRAAARAGISPTYLDKLERGERAPSTTVAEQLIAALELPPAVAEQLRAESVPGTGKDRP